MQMRVDDGKPIGIVHGQCGDRPFRGVQFQIFDNGSGIGRNVFVALPHKLGRSCGTRGGEKQRKLVVKRKRPFFRAFQKCIAVSGIHGIPPEGCAVFLRKPQVARPVGFQKGIQKRAIHMTIQHERHYAVVQEGHITHDRPRGIRAKREHKTAPRHMFRQLPGRLSKPGIRPDLALFVNKRRMVFKCRQVPHSRSIASHRPAGIPGHAPVMRKNPCSEKPEKAAYPPCSVWYCRRAGA